MAEVQVLMPKMGESVMEATVLHWLKQEGEKADQEESILEVATDKVDLEVPTPRGGTIKRHLVQAGDVVPIGAPIALLESDAPSQPDTHHPKHSPPKPTPSVPPTEHSKPKPRINTNQRTYSPLVRNMAQQAGVSKKELQQVPGTGKNNRLTQQDLTAYLAHRPAFVPSNEPLQALEPEDQVVPLGRVRQLIAARMVHSKRTAPHVTSFVEADVTELVAWQKQNKPSFEQEVRVKLTYTPLLLHAIAQVLPDFPQLNAWMQDDHTILKKDIHLGVAVALEDGNLVVPVIRHADRLSITELAIQLQEVVQKARGQQLKPDELAGATYTVSNLGTFKTLMGTPIIMPPQVAIMALGAIEKRPTVLTDKQGDRIAIRSKMYLSHAYDHRVVDGALGGQFAYRVVQKLECFTQWCVL